MRQKSQTEISKGSLQVQSRIEPFQQKCQKVAFTVLRTGHLGSLLKYGTVKKRWPWFSQFLGFTKGSGYAINIVRAFIIKVRENEKDYLKDYLDLRNRIIAAMLIKQCMIKQCIKAMRGGCIKTVNHVEGGGGKGVFEGFGRKKKCVLWSQEAKEFYESVIVRVSMFFVMSVIYECCREGLKG